MWSIDQPARLRRKREQQGAKTYANYSLVREFVDPAIATGSSRRRRRPKNPETDDSAPPQTFGCAHRLGVTCIKV
jgi:hypothetical protein